MRMRGGIRVSRLCMRIRFEWDGGLLGVREEGGGMGMGEEDAEYLGYC